MIEISDINDQRISFYRSLRFTPVSHTKERVFIGEGEKVVIKLLKSKLTILSLFCTEEFIDKHSNLIKQRNIEENSIFLASKNFMQEVIGFKVHSGIMAMASIPPDIPLEQLSDKIIVLNNIIDAENVGAIVRNIAAFGFDSILVDEKSSSPFLRRSVRVSMGNVIDMKVNHSKNIYDSIFQLKQNHYKIISSEITGSSQSVDDFHFPEKFALVFGNEGNGIDKEMIELSDAVVHIPINLQVSSINVAASSAVILHEIRKQMK